MEKRNDTHIQVLQPEIKEMLEKGKAQREVAERFWIQGQVRSEGAAETGTPERAKAGDRDLTAVKGRPEKLAERIAQQRERSFRTYGYRRMWLWLNSQNIDCNPKTVLRIMQKYDLLSEIRRRRKQQQMGQQGHIT